jgi:uncharacterized membrane protein (DUF485 family)
MTARSSPPDSPSETGESPGDLESRSAAMHDDPRFRELRGRLLRFVVPMSIGFFAWYLLYVLMSAYTRDVLAVQLVSQLLLVGLGVAEQ